MTWAQSFKILMRIIIFIELKKKLKFQVTRDTLGVAYGLVSPNATKGEGEGRSHGTFF